ncbi:B12-binding domain-containing radical SAM protein [bacterium]|nr:B12-binding domain-containing radical SAM protein [bacterium]
MQQPMSITQNQREPKIVLVACPYSDDDYMTREDIAIDDLGLGYLYSALVDKGFSVTLIDSLRPTSWFISPFLELEDRILELKPDYIGFSDPSVTFTKSLSLSRRLNEKLPDLVVIYGDIHPSLFNKEILENEPHVDYIICGEGEKSLPLLIEALENQQFIKDIPGLTYRENGVIKETPPYFEKNLDSLSFPYRPSLAKADVKNPFYYNIISSRGCPGHCTFCSMSTFLNRFCPGGTARWRARSAENVFEEMNLLYQKGVRQFLFFDDNWIGERETGLKRALKLCDLLIENGLSDISFSALMRPDSLLPTDRNALIKMKRAGLSSINMGLEAGNQFQLNIFGKKYDTNQVKDLTNLIFETGIMMRAGFIMFFPYSTFEMLRENARFLHDAGLSSLFEIYCGNLVPFSATAIETRLKKDNLLERSTTYNSPGVYLYQNDRIEDLQRFMLSKVLPERQFVYELLTVGTSASRCSRNGEPCFRQFQAILKRVGEASHALFEFSIDIFESATTVTEAIRICSRYSQHWLKVLETEKRSVAEFKTRLPVY